MTRRQAAVDPGKGAERLRGAQLVLRQARRLGRLIAILGRLFEKQAVLDERAAEFEPGRVPAQANDVERRGSTSIPKRWIRGVHVHFPLVGSRTGLNNRHTG